MRPELVLTRAIMPSVDAELERDNGVHRVDGRADLGSLPDAVRDRVRAIATRAGVGVAPELIEALPNLEIVSVYGVGTDKIDLEHARMRGVHVTNTPDVLTADVADMALGLAQAALRRLCSGDRFVREGRDQDGLTLLRARIRRRFPWLVHVYADAGYQAISP